MPKLSKKDNLIGSGSDDKTIRLWRKSRNSNSSNKTRCLSAIQLRSCINSLAFSPDGKHGPRSNAISSTRAWLNFGKVCFTFIVVILSNIGLGWRYIVWRHYGARIWI